MIIRVLMVSESRNPYIKEIKEGLGKYVYIQNSISDFLNKQGDYTIVHFHWPEEITRWQIPTSSQIAEIREALDHWQKKAVLIITRHNILPNKPCRERYSALYDLLYSRVNAIVHLAKYSLKDFAGCYRDKHFLHKIIPHHVYRSYPDNINRDIAREYLKIPQNKKVILCFGNIRRREEALMILNAYKTLNVKKKFLLVPRFFKRPSLRREPFKRLWIYVKQRYYHFFFKASLGSVTFVYNDDVQYYFDAADVVFIPRSRQLNSGVVFLALAFGKVIVGPAGKNIGEVISSLNDPVFNPEDNRSIAKALEEAIKLAEKNKGIENLQYANKYYSLEQSIEKHLELYKELLGE